MRKGAAKRQPAAILPSRLNLDEGLLGMKINPRRRRICVCLTAALVVVFCSLPCQAADKMILVGTVGVKESIYGKWLTLIFTEAFSRLGYRLQYDG